MSLVIPQLGTQEFDPLPPSIRAEIRSKPDLVNASLIHGPAARQTTGFSRNASAAEAYLPGVADVWMCILHNSQPQSSTLVSPLDIERCIRDGVVEKNGRSREPPYCRYMCVMNHCVTFDSVENHWRSIPQKRNSIAETQREFRQNLRVICR
jgi:hypothetical protein